MSEAARMLLGGTLPPQAPTVYQPRPDRTERPHKTDRPERPPRQKTQINDPLHTVFFYNIPYTTTVDEIRQFALQYGEIMNLHPNISGKGQAFATYYDIRDAERAVADVQDKDFNGRRISSNFAFRPPNLGKRDQPTSANVLVKPVNYLVSLSEKDVSDALKPYGEIRSISLKEGNTYLVRFFNIRDAKACAQQSRVIKTLAGEQLDIQLPQEEDQPKTQPKPAQIPPNQPPPPGYPPFVPPGYPPPQYGAPPQYPYPYPFPSYGMPPPQYGMPPQGQQSPGQGQNSPNGQPPQYGMPPYPPYPPYGMPPQQQVPQQPPAQPKPETPKGPNFDVLSKLVNKQF